MPIDPSIALGVRQPQFDSPVNQLAKVMQIKDLQQNQQMNAMKMDEYQRGIADQNQLRSALSQPGADPVNALLRAGRVKEAAEYQKSQADIGKTNVDADAKKLEMAHRRVEMVGQGMGWLRQNPTPENAQLMVQTLVQQGIAPPEMAQGLLAQIQKDPSPQNITRLATMGFQAALATKEQLPKYDTRNLGGVTQMTATDPVTGQVKVVNSAQNTQSPDNAASVAATMRGQNMADARARESQAIQRDAANAGKVPAGYRMKADGSLEFIPGGPADPNAAKRAAPTEFQGKAAMFGTRAQEADRIISELEGKYSPTGINTKQAMGGTPVIGGALEAGANLALSDASQKAEQAQRDFVNAVLRLESGATIQPAEFDNAKRQYFPQPGDSKAVIAQKAANRKTAIQGLINNARPGAVEPVSGGLPADIAAILKKHGGK